MFESVDITKTIDANAANSSTTATIEVLPLNMQLLGLEVTQGVQDMKNSVPLVEGK